MFENCYLMLIYFNNKKNKQTVKSKNIEKQEEKIIEYKDIFYNKYIFYNKDIFKKTE